MGRSIVNDCFKMINQTLIDVFLTLQVPEYGLIIFRITLFLDEPAGQQVEAIFTF